MSFLDYKKLDVWIQCYELTILVYRSTHDFPKSEQFGMTPQLRRAAVSVLSNIAEGSGRQHRKEKVQFLCMSRGSLFELESQIEIALGLKMLSDRQYEKIHQQVKQCLSLVNGFIKYQRNK